MALSDRVKKMETSRDSLGERSPDLFSDDEDLKPDIEPNQHSIDDVNDSLSSNKDDEKVNNSIEKSEKAISKRITSLLAGVVPPPSITYIQYDIGNLLSMYKRNVVLMDSGNQNDGIKQDICDHISMRPLNPDALDNIKWPEIEMVNAYGVHYNRTKYTENIESMYMKLVERNVGQETGSSFTYNAAMSAKKKQIQKKL